MRYIPSVGNKAIKKFVTTVCRDFKMLFVSLKMAWRVAISLILFCYVLGDKLTFEIEQGYSGNE